MRIIKDLPVYHQDDKYIDKDTPLGEFIIQLIEAIGDESGFLKKISTLEYWNYPKISLWAFENILNEIDLLLSKYKIDIERNQESLMIIFSFFKILLNNTTNKDIFSSFDHLQDIFFASRNTSIKVEILEIYLLLIESRKSLNSFYLDFIDLGAAMIDIREYVIEILLQKSEESFSNEPFLLKGLEGIVLGIQKNWKKICLGKPGQNQQNTSTPSKLKITEITPSRLFNYITDKNEFHSYSDINQSNNSISAEIIKDYDYYTSYYKSPNNITKEEKNYKMMVDNILILISELYEPNDSNLPTKNFKDIVKFVLILINIYISLSQKCKKFLPVITEYYIERYLKDVLLIVTSSNSLEIKSIFLISCISFMNNFDGYESILFQNGLFHSILSDLTHQNTNNLEVLSYEDSIDQNFFNSVLVFLYKTSSFKEIPVHFLNKVLDIPKNNIYPFRIDNVIFSLKKKRIIDETTMRELIVPRLLYELNNIFVKDTDLSYIQADGYHPPSIFERSTLISKIFKVIFLIYDQNNNISLLRCFEEQLIQSVITFLSSEQLMTTRIYDSLFFSCAELLIKMCFIVPHKIPQFIESKGVDLFFAFFIKKIPKINGSLNLLFQLIYSVCLHEEGKNYLLKNNNAMISEVVENMFTLIIKDDYLHYYLTSINDLLDDDLYSPYISFLRIEGINSVIVGFFEKLSKFMNNIKDTISSLSLPENQNSLEFNIVTYKVSKYIQLLHFFIQISQEERDLLNEKDKIDTTSIIEKYYDLLYNPLVLYSISNTVLSSIIIKILSPNPHQFIKKVHDNFMKALKEIKESTMSQIQKDKAFLTLMKNVEISVKKIYPLIFDKTYIDNMMIEVADLIIEMVKQQTNVRVCMAPVNDFVLIIRGRSYYKFISNKVHSDLRELIIKNTKDLVISIVPTLINPEVTIIDEDNYLTLFYDVDFSSNFRVEFISDSNSFVYNEVIDQGTKLLTDIIPILDFLITSGKHHKVNELKEVKETEIVTITTWMNLAYILTNLLKSIRDTNVTTDDNKLEMIILYTNILQNINLITKDKNFSSVVIFYFIKYGGIREIFLIIKDILLITEEIKTKTKELLVKFLLIENLWNILLTIITNMINYDFEHSTGFFWILLKEDMSKFNLKTELSVYVKHLIINDLIEVFFNRNKSELSLKDISKDDSHFHLMVFNIIDVSLAQFKNLIEIKYEDIKIHEIEQMGFSKASIIQSIQEGFKKKDDIVNYLITPKKEEEEDDEKEDDNPDQEIQIESNPAQSQQNQNKEKPKISKTNEILELIPKLPGKPSDEFISKISKEQKMIIEESPHRNDSNSYTKDNFLHNLSIVYNLLSNDVVSKDKITQLRKMNLIYRIKEIKNETDLIPYLRQILILERENLIDTTSQSDPSTLNKILNNKMLMNYIIFKDRSKYNNFFEMLDVDKLSAFVDEFTILENNLNSIIYYSKMKIEDNSIILKIIYECFHMIYIVISFITHFKTEKNDLLTAKKAKYIDTFLSLLSNPSRIDQNILILVLTTITQNFNRELLRDFVIKGGVAKLLQLKFDNKNAYSTFYDNKFKNKVTIDETIRLFIFKLFIDDNSHQNLFEGIFKYIFSNNKETNDVNEIDLNDFLKVISEFVSIDMKQILIDSIKSMCEIVEKQIKIDEEEDNDSESEKVKSPSFNLPNKDNDKSNKNKNAFKSPKHSNIKKKYLLRLKPQFQASLALIISELKLKENDSNLPNNEVDQQFQSPKQVKGAEKITQNTLSQSILNSRKKTEDQIAKVSKIFSQHNLTVVNSLIKHIWRTCSEIEKEIEKNSHNVRFTLERKYIIDLDTSLISFTSLIHAFPGLLSIILKYHKQKQKISFISFLIKDIFYVLSFYNNCTLAPDTIKSNSELIEKIAKEKPEETVKRLGTEVNSSQSVMEAYRYSKIISNIMQAFCYRRRNMNEDEIFLIHKCRKKVLNEINQIISEISLKKINEFNNSNMTPNSNLQKSLIQYKACINALFSLTEFHEESHVYSQMNPFEISKLVFSKENDIIKNICSIMKGLSLNNKTSCYFHKLTTLYYSEIFKFLLINAKMKRGTVISKSEIDNDIEMDDIKDINIEIRLDPNEDDQLPEDNDNEEEDGGDDNDENEDDDEDDDENEDEDEDEDEDENESNEMYYSITSSENDNDINDHDLHNDNDDDEDDEDEDEIDFMGSVPGSFFNFDGNNNRTQLINFIRDNIEEEEEEEEFEDMSEGDSHQMNIQDVAVRFDDDGNAYVDQDRSESQLDFEDNIINYHNPREIGISNARVNSFIFGNGGLVLNRNAGFHRNNWNNEYRNNEILFHNPFYDSQMSNTELKYYFEDSLTFPFIINLCHRDDLLEFYISNIFVSLINRLGKNFVDKSTQIFQCRFINPFDTKSKRNLAMVLIGAKEKVLNAYGKEFNKLTEQLNYLDTEFTFVENKQELINLIKEVLTKENNVVIEKPKDKRLIIKDMSNKKTLNDDIKQDELEKTEIKLDNEFLMEIPEELREGVIQKIDTINEGKDEMNLTKIPENNFIIRINDGNSVNNQVKQEEIPQNIRLTSLTKEQIEDQTESPNNNPIQEPIDISNIPNTDNNNPQRIEDVPVFDTQFIESLPQDLREDILLNLDPSTIEHLSMPLLEEYNRLTGIGPLYFFPENEEISNNIERIRPIRRTSFKLEKIKFKIEDILSQQKHSKEHSMYILNLFDDDFIENLLLFNIKYICEAQPKCRISLNQYWTLANQLIQNAHLRHKILDLLFLFWICDSMCLKKLLKSPNGNDLLNKNPLLRSLNEIFVEESMPEDFFIDDYDRFLQIFCTKFQKEMKKLFLETVYNNKGEYVLIESKKKYQMSKNSHSIKDILKIHFDEKENVLSNLLSLMLINSKTDIKKIFALKIFTNIIQNCFRSNGPNLNNSLKLSNMTINKIIDLFYNFDTVLKLSKGQISNNPSNLLCEMIQDYNFFSELLLVLQKHVEQLNIKVGIEMESFFKNQKIDIKMFSKPLPENVLFKFVKLINQMNEVITKKYDDKTAENNNNNEERPLMDNNDNENNNNNNNNDNNNNNNNNDNNINMEEPENQQALGDDNIKEIDDKEEEKLIEKIQNNDIKDKSAIKDQYRKELNRVINSINNILFKCWENLDILLFEINKLLKDDQKTIVPKLNRLIPYLEAFITLSHLQFLQNISFVQSNPFLMEKAYRSSPRKTPMKSIFYSPSGPYTNTFSEFFYKFCEKNKKVINLILRRYPKMFPNELLIKISNFLDLENKKKYFKCELKKLQTSHDNLNVTIRRNELFQDSFSQLSFKPAENIRGRITIHFDSEEAVDAGGVKREWITWLSKEMFNPNYMLFTLAKNGTTYTPNTDSGKFNTEHLRHFEFIGRIIAKAIFDGIMIDCYFTRSFYKIISNTPLTYHDMEDYDSEYFNSLRWLLENDITDMDVYLTYSFVHDNLGQIEVIDLIENGRNIEVNESNKFDYVQKLCYAKLFDAIKPQVEAFLKGFYEIIPLKLIAIFDHRELELVISGLPSIDIIDLKHNTQYENYTEQSKVIKHFWEILETFDNDECAEFLQFVTGSSKVPLEGFASLQGIGGVNKFKIAKVFETNYDRLPTAHTCTNQLDLPDYPSKEILQERLTFAIKEGKQGFGFI